MMSLQEFENISEEVPELPQNYQDMINRFGAACQADERAGLSFATFRMLLGRWLKGMD